MKTNPFREKRLERPRPQPCTLVIFGATGDLTRRKLIPALYNIAADGELPTSLKVVGFARREKSDEEFRADLEEKNREFSRQGHDSKVWSNFAGSISYHQSEFQDADGYRRLREALDRIDKDRGAPGNRLFYLACAPEFFDDIMIQLRESGLSEAKPETWARVVVEKPFGRDLASARELNRIVAATFQERDTYRIDHYLGKETAQNIMVLRFANAILEPLWNQRHIDHVQITTAETVGVGTRGGYYDSSGALRDMVQNHLLQLLSLVAMEPPTDLSADSIRDEKVKVIRSLTPVSGPDVADNVVRARYEKGSINGEDVPGYLDEDRVAPDSNTETYVALRVFVENWRWHGVPFYVRVGKRLPKKSTEISIHFKEAPGVLFGALPAAGRGNVLVIRIQPDEGFSLRMLSKAPGASLIMEPVKMDFRYSTSFGKASPEAYERLLLDAMSGDATLFARDDEVEHAWRFVDEIESAWHASEAPPPLAGYAAGTWGPPEADALLENDNRAWRRL